MELADLMQPLDIPAQNNELPNMENNSELTLSLGSNAMTDSDNSIDAPLPLLEGNDHLNNLGQAQEVFNGLPDLNLLLGPI